MLSLEQLRFLTTPAAQTLLSAVLPDDALAAQKTLRKQCSPDEARAVAELKRLRSRAAASGRFPADFAARMLATDKMLQQASSFRMAVYVGAQLAELSGDRGPKVLDLCCGMGADTIGIALAGAKVRGIDIDERAVFCAAHNAEVAGVGDRCSFELGDVESMELTPHGTVHVDPDRRPAFKRMVQLADCRPGPAFLQKLLTEHPRGAMKLSPALSFHALDEWPDIAREYVSEDGVCKQLIVWWGGPVGRKATVVSDDMARPGFTGIEDDALGLAPLKLPGPWIIEPDPAVIAADAVDSLARRHGLWRIDASLAWIGSDQPVRTPLARSYRVLREVPGRTADVSKAVRQLDGGAVQVKTRGVKLDTDSLQRKLSDKKGSRRLVVLWCRTNRAQRAFIAEAPSAS